MFDPTTNQHSTTSFLLYLTNVEDGGATVCLAGGRWGQGDAPPVVMGTRAEKKAEQVAGNGAGGVAEGNVETIQVNSDSNGESEAEVDASFDADAVQQDGGVVAADDANASARLCAYVVAEAAPRVGSILVFPHLAPHEGLPVWDEPKILLRGDCY